MENQIEKSKKGGGSVFISADSFEHAQRVATMLSKSELVPKTFQGKVHNCVIALEMAQRIGASPLMVMQNMDIIHGRPSWRSQFLIATFNANGKFSSIRYEEEKKNGGRIRAIATDLSNGEDLHGTWVSMEMAKAEGWIDKNGSKWKTIPQLMMRYRAAAFFVRQFAPEISMGLMTNEESYDVGVIIEDADATVVTEKKIAQVSEKKEKLKEKAKPKKEEVKPSEKKPDPKEEKKADPKKEENKGGQQSIEMP